ncbi:MAG: NADPH-dependent FMN reductase, partial [Burkholderiales bacterium]
MLKIAGVCGSLRAASYNRMLMQLAESLLPASMQLDVLEWRDVPVFDADVLAKGLPPPVAALRERVRGADGLLIVTPEYNFSIPGGLKNVIDWLSRGEDQPLSGKPVAMLSATGGPLGGARVQYDLRTVMLFVNAMALLKPEVFVGNVAAKFSADGQCTDEATRKFVGAQMAAFEQWIGAVKRMAAASPEV